MKKLLTVLALMVVITPVHAGVAYLKYEYTNGTNRICIYNDLGSEVALTIKSYMLCPLTIET